MADHVVKTTCNHSGSAAVSVKKKNGCLSSGRSSEVKVGIAKQEGWSMQAQST